MTMFKTRFRRMYKEPGVIASFISASRSRRMYKEPGVVASFIRAFRCSLHRSREYTAEYMIDFFEGWIECINVCEIRLPGQFVAETLGCAFGMIFARDK